MKRHTRSALGFTLIELLVAMAVVAMLAAITLAAIRGAMDKSREAQSAQQTRQIIAALLARAADQNTFYSNSEVGFSSYRSTDDSLGLPKLLEKGGYLSAEKVWWVPGSRAALAKYNNSFCWNRSDSVCGKPLASMEKPSTISVLWSNYCYTLPSVKEVPEPSSTGGPRTPSSAYYQYPFRGGTSAHFAYADGHVDMQVLKK